MKIQVTKRNGIVALFETDKIVKSILKANADTPLETLTERDAEAIAAEVFDRVTKENEIVLTSDIRKCVYEVLRERFLFETARKYQEYGELKKK